MAKRRAYWITWGALTLAIAGYLALGLVSERAASHPLLATARTLFMPGKTSHGHYQIELRCEACHTEAFGGTVTFGEFKVLGESDHLIIPQAEPEKPAAEPALK